MDVMDDKSDKSLIAKTNQRLAVRRAVEYQADYIPHLDLEQIRKLIETAGKNRNGERDRLLVQLLFDGCLRCSEAISIRPQDIESSPTGWQVYILGKGKKRSAVAISASLAAQLQAYAYRNGIAPDARLFRINRHRVFQIVAKAMTDVGIVKPDGVGSVHILRHSGAIERLRRTGNPKAVQDQLRHKSALMTMRYMKTLSHEESLAIQQEVDFQW